jgi:deoxyadenosine/deoxycytidine kinase
MFILEGNIGAGKSTFLKLIEKAYSDIPVVQEPHENWFTPMEGMSLFEKFYHDPTRWAYTTETLVMMSRVKDHLRAQLNNHSSAIMERSVYSGHYCFAVNGFNSGYFSELEWDAYSKILEFMVKEQCKIPQGFIYLRVNPDVCRERICKRNRKGEEDLSQDYLLKIHELHENFLIKKIGIFDELKSVPVLILDGGEDFVDSPQVFEQHLMRVREFIAQTQMVQNILAAKSSAKSSLNI